VREIAEELKAAEPDRTVQWQIAAEARLEGDRGLLRVALQNLIGNAWKYSSKRDVAHIEFGTMSEDGQPVYFVRDNGAGFDMAYAEKLFGAFQRLHSPAEFPGTGIGLATVARIIHRHEGEIWAEGKVGEGASFYFCLGRARGTHRNGR
jgi:light-regulated signal transduction histidine kinase (bacteriophytochrome)